MLVISGKAAGDLIAGMKSEAAGFSAGSRHNEYIKIAVAVGSKGNGFAIVRPYRRKFIRLTDRKRYRCSSRSRHFIDISFITEQDGLAVGRNSGIAHPERIYLS